MREMWKALGEYDALAQYLELTSRKFQSEYAKIDGLSFAEFLTQEAQKEDVPTRNLTLNNYLSYKIMMFLTLPYSSFDHFIDEFKNDYNKLFGQRLEMDGDGSNYDKLIKALKKNGICPQIDKFKVDLFNYYRLVRNVFAHQCDTITKINHAFSAIDKKQVTDYYTTLAEPKSYDQLVFNDYVLCTANIKNISDIITESLGEKVDWLDYARRNANQFKKLKGRTLTNRVYHSIMNSVSSDYGIILDVELCKQMYSVIMEEL